MPADYQIVHELEDAPYVGVELVAYAIMRLAAATEKLAVHVKYLGNGDAATTMGAIEAFSVHLGEKLDALADAVRRDEEEIADFHRSLCNEIIRIQKER